MTALKTLRFRGCLPANGSGTEGNGNTMALEGDGISLYHFSGHEGRGAWKSEMKENRDAGYYDSYVYNSGKNYAPETDNKKETET